MARMSIDEKIDQQKEVEDYMLTRHACYLIAENGDPRKEIIMGKEHSHDVAISYCPFRRVACIGV